MNTENPEAVIGAKAEDQKSKAVDQWIDLLPQPNLQTSKASSCFHNSDSTVQ